MPRRRALDDVLAIMARLRAPNGCPWDLEQDHRTLRYHAIEEAYELLDAIEAGDDGEFVEELGDVLLQVVFHCQLGQERGAFDFEAVCRRLADKLIHRHPHVFGDTEARTAGAVLEQWEKIKRAEKTGTRHERHSALDGVPHHLPALLRAQKLWKKANKAGLAKPGSSIPRDKSAGQLSGARARRQIGSVLFAIARRCQENGWIAEDLLRQELRRMERTWRKAERAVTNRPAPTKRPQRKPASRAPHG